METKVEIFQPKIKEVSLFGYKLKLYESSTKDFLDLMQFIIENNQNKETSFLLYQDYCIIYNSLKPNLKNITWYRLDKKILFNKVLSLKFLINYLKPDVLKSFVKDSLELQELCKEKESIKKVNTGQEFLGSEQGYALLMHFFGWTVEQIDNLPVSKYLMFTNEALNLAALKMGGKYKFASTEDELKFKKYKAFSQIQELKRRGKWH